MDFIKEYLKMRCKIIFMLFLLAVILMLCTFAYGFNMNFAIYILAISTFVVIIFATIDFITSYKKYCNLKKILESKLEIPITDSENIIEQLYNKIILSNLEFNKDIKSKYENSKDEIEEYYTLWVHQIKTPISAMKLLLQTDQPPKNLLDLELFKIEQYVDMALQYARVDNSSNNDLLIKEYNLEHIVKKAIRNYAKIFISKKIKIEVKDINTKIITDEKWLRFVIEQILSNSLKYTNKGKISIYLDKLNKGILVIKDTGIGINKEDIPRIFEKGFTGYNGRNDKKSTGIGLYLSKKVLDKLGHKINITSEPEIGTIVEIDFNRQDINCKD